MSELLHTAEEIKLKVKRLLQESEAQRNELISLKQENAALKNLLEEQKNSLSELKETNKIVKIAERLSSTDTDVQLLKKKLHAHIREIDECIRLLSDR